MTNQEFKNCIDACYACATACDNCATSYLEEPKVKEMTRCIQLDCYCADICRLAASFMARAGELEGDKYARQLCNLCAQICEECGVECEKHEAEHCQRCAEACKRCADECRHMAG